MRLSVDKIDDVGESHEAGLGDAWARDAAQDALSSAATDLAASLHVRYAHGLVFVTGSVRASADATCERCDHACTVSIDAPVDLSYRPSGVEVDHPMDLELRSDELDVGWYENGEIALADVLSEAIALALPPRTLCADVPACDARVASLLEAGQPGDEESSGHPGFAALKNWSRT